MNKGIKEPKSDTKRIKNISKIATRIISEKKRSPTGSKERSVSMNSLVSCGRIESPKKLISKEANPKMANGIPIKKVCDIQKSAECRGSHLKNERPTRSSKIQPIENTGEIKDPINQKSKSDQKEKMFDKLIANEGSIEKLLQIKKTAKTVYNVDNMSSNQIRESLNRIDDKTAKPFSFLNDIINHSEKGETNVPRDTKDQELNPTDIDLQLSSLVKRVELNRTLLERTNERIKDINFLAERNKMISIRDMSYDEESFLKMKNSGDVSKEPVSATDLTAVSHPAVEELQKTMRSTIEMLGYVHKMSSGDLASGGIPPELTHYLTTPIITARENLQ